MSYILFKTLKKGYAMEEMYWFDELPTPEGNNVASAGKAQKTANGSIKLAGCPYYQPAILSLTVAEQLWIIPEPNNPYDQNALSVCKADGTLVGYLPKKLAKYHSSESGAAEIVSITRQSTGYVVKITILKESPNEIDN
jgi:hypothetical protein